jgi:hypothetical protein
VGSRITWHRAQPVDFIRSSSASWDVAILAHSIWYFASSQVLVDILRALRGRASRVCIAEYALQATDAAAAPHVLAALARGMLECHKSQSEENIRSPLSPAAITAVAAEAGWTLEQQSIIVPGPSLLDGHWEASTVASKSFIGEIEDVTKDERLKLVLASARHAVVAAKDALGRERVKTMDVWVSSFA